MADPLRRFTDAQRDSYPAALAELRAGAKRGHFPQIRGLGTSAVAQHYAIADLAETRAYLAHPVLSARLIESAQALLPHRDRAIDRILGPVDAMKLRSSMTLFEVASDHSVFGEVLETFHAGERDPATLARL